MYDRKGTDGLIKLTYLQELKVYRVKYIGTYIYLYVREIKPPWDMR
jgi:hypothetical protein